MRTQEASILIRMEKALVAQGSRIRELREAKHRFGRLQWLSNRSGDSGPAEGCLEARLTATQRENPPAPRLRVSRFQPGRVAGWPN